MSLVCATLLFAATALAQDAPRPRTDQLLITSNGTGPPFGHDAFNSAPQYASRDVSFARGSRQDWTWTLSISDVELPITENSSEYTSGWNAAPKSRVAYTRSSFNWPQDLGNINQVVRSETQRGAVSTTSRLYHIWSDFPENVTSAWDSTSSSCTSAIGEDCEGYITSSLVLEDGCTTENFPSLIRSCPGSFGPVPANETALESGDTVSYTVSDLHTPGNDTALEYAKNRLHMAVMASGQGKQVLCNRIADASADATASSPRAGFSIVLMSLAAAMAIGLGVL